MSMTHTLNPMVLGFLLVSVATLSVGCAGQPKPIALIPQPVKVVVAESSAAFHLDAHTQILTGGPMGSGGPQSAQADHVGQMLAARLAAATGWKIASHPNLAAATAPRNAIVVEQWPLLPPSGAAFSQPEGYELKVTPNTIFILASTPAGLFYATQTLLQLLPPQVYADKPPTTPVDWSIPCVTIDDQPRFAWRGLELDVSRHFFTKDEVKKFLDEMAMHKFNVFHWHLVDDQGWRIEIKKYPKLTEVGAWRDGIGFQMDPKSSTTYGPDGRYGGFYTQDDIREVVAYAKERYITIVPEIEMPGHAGAALAAYPQFCCSGLEAPVSTVAGVKNRIYCPGNDAAFEFLQNILTEVIDLFPGQYLHIGGDEVRKGEWQKCPKCQARIASEHLKDTEELQSYFVRRMEKFINARGKTMIGWDEILQGGLAPNAAVMSWRGEKGGITAANADHDVVMTPTDFCYLDYPQGPWRTEPRAMETTVVDVKKVYSYEPIPAAVAADKQHHVLGVQGNLWSEYIANFAHVEYMAWPRGCALAEVAWSPKDGRNLEDLQRRLDVHVARLDAAGINYRKPKPTDTQPATTRPAAP